MKTLLILSIFLVGCAHRQLSTPSPVGVSSGIGRTKISVEEAKKYNDLAVIHNAGARTRVERIEAKSRVIQQYWNTSGK